MKKVMMMVAVALLAAASAEAQNVRKATRQYNKEARMEELKKQRALDSLKRANEIEEARARHKQIMDELSIREVKMPCADLGAVAEGAIRSNAIEGVGKSKNQIMSAKMALTNARKSLASTVSTFLGSITHMSDDLVQAGDNEMSMTQMHQQIIEKVMQQLNNAPAVCEKVLEQNGTYISYAVVELAAPKVKNLYDQLSNDKMLPYDYNFERFKSELEAEVEKFEAKE